MRKEKSQVPVEVVTMVQATSVEGGSGPNFAINTMHKRKAKKIQLVDDSGQPSREIEGFIDWKERARKEQIPNADSNSALFKDYFEPRYAPFPRGTRITPERIASMKISPELQPRERDMLIELLYQREAALAWDFRESGRVSREVIPLVRINTVPHTA